MIFAFPQIIYGYHTGNNLQAQPQWPFFFYIARKKIIQTYINIIPFKFYVVFNATLVQKMIV